MNRFLKDLSPREKKYLLGLIVFLLITNFFFASRAVMRYLSNLAEASHNAEQDTAQLESIGHQYQLLQSVKTGEGADLDAMLGNIENLLKSLNLREKVGTLTPQDTVVQNNFIKREIRISLKDIVASQALDLIAQIEQSTQNLFKVESFSYRPVLRKPGIYDATITISGFQRKTDGK